MTEILDINSYDNEESQGYIIITNNEPIICNISKEKKHDDVSDDWFGIEMKLIPKNMDLKGAKIISLNLSTCDEEVVNYINENSSVFKCILDDYDYEMNYNDEIELPEDDDDDHILYDHQFQIKTDKYDIIIGFYNVHDGTAYRTYSVKYGKKCYSYQI